MQRVWSFFLEDFAQKISPWLGDYGVGVAKLLFVLLLILIVFVVRRLFVMGLKFALLRIELFKDATTHILERLPRTINLLFIVINSNMIVYIYNDFSSIVAVTRFFNMLYAIIEIYIVYTIVNTAIAVKLSSFNPHRHHLKRDVVNVGIKIMNFIIFLMGLLVVLYFAGVDLTAVLSGLGIGGFALAFAAKDTISNFFGTLSVLFSDVFSQGDWIEIDGKEGTVVEIGLRVTTIRTFDNALISIPNGIFASKDVKNWNKRKVGRRIKMNIGVTYNSKVQDIQNAVKQIRQMLLQHPDIATPNTKYEHAHHHSTKLVSKDDLEGVKTTLLVYLDTFADSSINILVYCFSKSVKWEDWLQTKEDVMHKIMEIIEQNNLSFAFPSLSIYDETRCKKDNTNDE